MKSKQKKKLAIAGVFGGLLLFVGGAALKSQLPDEVPMSAPDWYERETARNDREFHGYGLMMFGGFMTVVSVSELVRQARKLKV